MFCFFISKKDKINTPASNKRIVKKSSDDTLVCEIAIESSGPDNPHNVAPVIIIMSPIRLLLFMIMHLLFSI